MKQQNLILFLSLHSSLFSPPAMVILNHFRIASLPIHPIIRNTAKTTEVASQKREIEIRVCTNRTCRRQGSFQTLETLLSLSPPHVSVKPCGCLGRCGSGPNLVALPDAVFISHCGSSTQAARVMAHFCGQGSDNDDIVRKSLDALALWKRAEIELERGEFFEAEAVFSQAIEAKPMGGIHVAYEGRSAARLASRNFMGALEDAKEALVWDPQYAEAYICQGDAFLAVDQLEGAEDSYNMALACDPSLCGSKSFKGRIEKLRERMTSAVMT